MTASLANLFIALGIPPVLAGLFGTAAGAVLILLAALLAYWGVKRYLVHLVELICSRSRNTWDDVLVESGFLGRLAYLVPPIVVYMSVDLFLPDRMTASELIKRLAMTLFVFIAVWVLDALLTTVRRIYDSSAGAGARPIRSYTDAAKIILFAMAAIFVIATLTGKSPWGILSVLGGFTVVLMLVFKDTILGFVASIQLSIHDMVRVGDWIEMSKYGADGDVIDVSINTVKVRNWDKTITTIPTYSLVSDSFKNWRGMTESGGRRIKRSLYIDMNSVRFCTDAMIERFSRFQLIADYLKAKKTEIDSHNREHNVDASQLINGRRQTNLGVFRAYVAAYLKNHPRIHPDMTFLVRHLAPGPTGIPVEIYVFSSDQVWANYEAIQADIFDHLLAAVGEFDLRVFQNPSGRDFTALLERQPAA